MRSGASFWMVLCLMILSNAAMAQPVPPEAARMGAVPGAPPAAIAAMRGRPAPVKADDKTTTMMLNLNNMGIDQLISFLSTTTNRPVTKYPNVQAQISISSPVPVTKDRALQLIYNALQGQGVYVVDNGQDLNIVTAEQMKTMPKRSIAADEDIQKLDDSPQLAQKIYRLRMISPDNLKQHLEKIIPKDAMTVDPASNTVMIVDRIERLKQYDKIIAALDQAKADDRVTDIVPLVHADAMELAMLVCNVISQTATGSGAPPSGGGPGGGPSPDMMGGGFSYRGMRSMGSSSSSSSSSIQPAAKSTSQSAGDVTIVADPRMNWLIIAAPQRKIADVRELIKRFDVPKNADIQTRTLSVKYMDVNALAQIAKDLVAERTKNKAERDQVSIVPADDGTRLLVLSSEANFNLIQDLAKKLDNEESCKRETRTFKIKYLEAAALAEQLDRIFEEQIPGGSRSSSGRSYSYTYIENFVAGSGTRPTFAPMPRNNTLLISAKPKDFEFIKKMIDELDIPVEAGQYEPHVFRIRNTDANEVLDVLKTIFEGQQNQRRSYFDMWDEIYNGSSRRQTDSIDAQFGKIRFVVDNVTNTIVALSSNPSNYAIIESVIEKLDKFDPESAQLMVFRLNYADALEVANHLNNLFSDGPVTRNASGANRPDRQNNNGYGNGRDNEETGDTDSELQSYFYDGEREVVYPWQSPGRNDRQRQNEEERPINTMIGNVRVVPDVGSNKILIAAPQIYYKTIESLLKEIDQPEPQVHIRVQIVEIQRNNDERIGIRWTPDPSSIDPAELENAILGLGNLDFVDAFGSRSGGQFDVKKDVVIGNGALSAQSSMATSTHRGTGVINTGVNLSLLVQLLTKNSNGRVLSYPDLTVNNNQLGTFKYASSYPFIESSLQTDVGGQTQGYRYRELGIICYLRPHINPKGEIVLKAAIENSRVRPGETFNGQLIPDLQRVKTEMKIKSGETMVIAGVLLDQQTLIKRGTPFLSRIPVVKWFCSKKDDSSIKRELVFFLTPEVITTDHDKAVILDRALERLDKIDPFPESPIVDKPQR